MSRRNRKTQPGQTVGKGNLAKKAADLQGRLVRGQGAASFTNQSLHKDVYNFDQPWSNRDAWLIGDDGQLVKATNYDVWNCTTSADCAAGFTCTAGKCISALDSGTYNHSPSIINSAHETFGSTPDSCPTDEQPQPPPFDPTDDDTTSTHTNCRPKRGDTTKSSCVTGTCGEGGEIIDSDFCDDPACRRNSECSKGSVCKDGECVSGCDSDKQCPDGFRCDRSGSGPDGVGRCVEEDPCQVNADCEGGKVCYVSADAAPGDGGTCIDNPCPSNFTFSGSDCEPKPCNSDDQCGEGEVCGGADEDGNRRCVPEPCSASGGGGDSCPEGSSCKESADGGTSCVPDTCDSNSDCPEGYACAGNGEGGKGCVEDPDLDPDTPPPSNSCKPYCDSAYKSSGEVGSGCSGKVCTECEECVNIRDIFGRSTFHCEEADDVPCTCPGGDEPGLCEKCDQDTGEIVPDDTDCEVCCTAPSIPCTEDCPSGDSDSVEVCVSLANYEASSGGYYVSLAQAAACKSAEQKRKASCDAKGDGCDCDSGMECSQDSHCTAEGLIWAQGSSVAYRLVGKCRSGWSGGVGGTCDVEEIEIPVDPSTGQPTN